MGKTFVEDERPCDQCVNRTRYGCASWDCKFIDRDEAIKAWKEKHEMADRKTENSSEKPNKSTISKMEQVDKDINVRSKDEAQRNMVEDIVESFGFKAESYRQAKAKTEQTERKGKQL